ncbi:MAG: EamA family transporter [Patescibacteria group bacterium]
MWFIIALVAFALLAVAAVADKFVLSKAKIVPISYSFYVAALGAIFSLLLLFFEDNFYFPVEYWHILVIGGIAFYFGIYGMYKAVDSGEVSKVNPLMISLQPLVVFVITLFVSIGAVTWLQGLGAGLLVIGSYYLSQVGKPKTRITRKIWFYILLSSVFFAISNSVNKIAYNELSFANAFIWLRTGAFVTGVIFTTIMGSWHLVFNVGGKKPGVVQKELKRLGEFFEEHASRAVSIVFDYEEWQSQKQRRNWAGLIIGQICGALGVVLMQYSISLGNVVLVTALNGIQFLFVLVLVYILSKFFPSIMEEDINKKYTWQKVGWACLLFVGIFLILI